MPSPCPRRSDRRLVLQRRQDPLALRGQPVRHQRTARRWFARELDDVAAHHQGFEAAVIAEHADLVLPEQLELAQETYLVARQQRPAHALNEPRALLEPVLVR